MKKLTFIYTIVMGVLWEIAYACVIIVAGLLIAFLVKFIK
jgi:hypothetical protein